MLLALLLACSSPEPPAPPAVEPADDAGPPPGRIGGEPILPSPTVIGAISAEAVERGVAAVRPAVGACWARHADGRARQDGKVLVRFVITVDGTVARAATHATSLRHPATEDCVVGVLAGARFDPLAAGDKAVVLYPLVFPP